MSRQSPDLRPQKDQKSKGVPDQSWRWIVAVLVVTLGVGLLYASVFTKTTQAQLSYSTFLKNAATNQVASATVDNTTGQITGTNTNGSSFTVNGPQPLINTDVQALEKEIPNLKFITPQQGLLDSLIVYVLPIGLFIAVMVWLNRRAQGQMSGIMSIGRSKAKPYSAERPKTTFDDVAGYGSVKREIKEVVD